MHGAQAVGSGVPLSQAVSLLLAGSLCLLPFLLPYHQPPILSFQAEWLAAALGTAAMLAALTRAREGAFAALPPPARWLLAFALLLGAHSLIGHANYPQQALLGALYVLYAVVLFWLGAQLAAALGLEHAASTLAACLLAGALATAAAGAIQFYGRPALLEDFVAELHGNVAYGNIAQKNLYANYIALGGTALLYLWQRGSLRSAYALAAALLLAWACALSGSRTVLLYALWITLLGALAGRAYAGAEARRLKFAAYGFAVAMLVAQLAIPWLNHALNFGPASQSAFERIAELSNQQSEGRWMVWPLALRVFATAPLAGAGMGEFAGAVFNTGLPAELERFGEVWTSPHNLLLHLLAETGMPGAFLALAGLFAWCWQAGRRYFAAPQPALWWIIAAVGIELIHSMLEYPLWSAHFLGVTALLMGLATAPAMRSGAASRPSRAAAAGMCIALALTLALLLRDTLRLDATRASGAAMTLASAADSARDAALLRDLARGLLAPQAELWIFLGAPLDRKDLAGRLELSARVARYYPSNAVIVRRAALLALDGEAGAARSLLLRALESFPRRRQQSTLILRQAEAADPDAIAPLLALAGNAGPGRR